MKVVAMRVDGAALIETREGWGFVLDPTGTHRSHEMPLLSFTLRGYWGSVPADMDTVAVLAQAISAVEPAAAA